MVRRLSSGIKTKSTNHWKDYRAFKTELDQTTLSKMFREDSNKFAKKRHKVHAKEIISKLKLMNSQQKYSYLSKISQEEKYHKFLQFNFFPKNLHEIESIYTLKKSLELSNEIEWNLYFFKKYKQELNDFIVLKQEYEKGILLGNWGLSSTILDTIHEKYGYSIWLIENRVNLLQLMTGIRSQKEYCDSIFQNYESNGFSHIYIDFISILNEENLTMEMFERRLVETKTQLPSIFHNCLLFKINYFDYLNLDENHNTFFSWIDSHFSLIDRYNCIVSLLHTRVAESIKISDFGIFENDRRLGSLIHKSAIDQIKYEDKHNTILEIFNLYENGNYEMTIEKGRQFLEIYPETSVLYEIYIKSHIYLNISFKLENNGILNSVLFHLYNILEYNQKKTESEDKLKKICFLYNKSSWSAKVYEILKSNENETIHGKNVVDSPCYYNLFYDLRNIQSYQEPEIILERLRDTYNNHLILDLAQAYIENDYNKISNLSIPEERKKDIK